MFKLVDTNIAGWAVHVFKTYTAYRRGCHKPMENKKCWYKPNGDIITDDEFAQLVRAD